MFDIDSNKCNGCGNCVHVCLQQAIFVHNGLAAINQSLCIQCGACSEMCPIGAIQEVIPAYAELWKGGDTMVYGYGRGFGRGLDRRGSTGRGFRGAYAPWPYTGRGRGGLPRCWYPNVSMFSSYSPASPFYSPRMTPEEEIHWLRNQAEAIKAELSQIEAKIENLRSTDSKPI